ncbi:transcription factor tau subunit sfc1 [Colletotrichum spaethianum]|uniref:Transcription factor tau subunit sfc1 n=1 Tax=Colletotrichum spaethianum TaxID=700344 RepID=A0AA37NW74_9PEZI|nr:transcription factor tau subunit sfc1 [Colletotrichum spaethianum]GKT44002.1 transcription factor tau subunit sfc1 [Colletotrichum spaethianum]
MRARMRSNGRGVLSKVPSKEDETSPFTPQHPSSHRQWTNGQGFYAAHLAFGGIFRSNWLVDPSTGSYTASIPSPTGIPADPELTAHGVDQARELGAHLLTVDPPIEAVYSSPYYRCLQTIAPFVALKQERLNRLREQDDGANAAAVTIRPEHGLCEWYGAAPFEHPTPASSDVLKSMFPHLDDTYQSAVVPARNGETIAQLHDRVAAGVQAIIEQCDAEGKRAVVLCSHAASIIALGRVLTGVMPESIDAEDFRAFTCGLSVYRRRAHSSSAQTPGIPGRIRIPTSSA